MQAQASAPEYDTLVTGSAGHLGHALMLELPRYGLTPIGLDIKKSEFTSLVGALEDRDFIALVFRKHKVRFVLHTATLHKPHVESHTQTDFVQTNIQGTLNLLEESNPEAFIFTSTTSTFAKVPRPPSGVVWIDENVAPAPKNIYGVTKVAAEGICKLVHEQRKFPVLVLKVGRFFPEGDDDPDQDIPDENLKICELMTRRVDIADVVTAHIAALHKAKSVQWGTFIISGPTPFDRSITKENQIELLAQNRPQQAEMLHQLKWRLPRSDRVYDSSKARKDLEWNPVYTFERAIGKISQGQEWRSDLAVKVGHRGYHAQPTGVYTL